MCAMIEAKGMYRGTFLLPRVKVWLLAEGVVQKHMANANLCTTRDGRQGGERLISTGLRNMACCIVKFITRGASLDERSRKDRTEDGKRIRI